jgi:hypothetical protein
MDVVFPPELLNILRLASVADWFEGGDAVG